MILSEHFNNLVLEYHLLVQSKINEVAKQALNEYGYPNNIVMYTRQQSCDVSFVDVISGETVVEVKFNETV